MLRTAGFGAGKYRNLSLGLRRLQFWLEDLSHARNLTNIWRLIANPVQLWSGPGAMKMFVLDAF